MLMKQTVNNNNRTTEAQALNKLAKACKSAFATSVLLQSTNEDLLLAARRQHKRITRIKDHYVDARIMNLDVIAERNQKAEDKA